VAQSGFGSFAARWKGNRFDQSLVTFGSIALMSIDAIRKLFTGKFPVNEAISQAWFTVKVSLLPTLLVAIPFGVIVSVQVGSVAAQVGAQSMQGASNGVAVIQQGAPIVVALLLAGAAGSAICADLGSRKIRDEIDAIEVMGLDPIRRLVGPRIVAMVVVGMLLCGVVIFAGVVTGYAFNVAVQNGTPGSYVSSLAAFASPNDLILAVFKSAIFGFMAAVIACYKGLNVSGGPKGVAGAVNASVVITFVLLFGVNMVLTQVYVTVFPPRVA